MGARWDVRVWRAGARGKNGPEDEDAVEREEVDSSDSNEALRDSRSIIYRSAWASLPLHVQAS